jgi:hypothetical protein
MLQSEDQGDRKGRPNAGTMPKSPVVREYRAVPGTNHPVWREELEWLWGKAADMAGARLEVWKAMGEPQFVLGHGNPGRVYKGTL